MARRQRGLTNARHHSPRFAKRGRVAGGGGVTPNPYTGRGAAEILAAQWREWHGGMAWLFDPWTGRRRDARDVGSDVHGLLIVPAGTLGMDMGGGCSEKDNVACA